MWLLFEICDSAVQNHEFQNFITQIFVFAKFQFIYYVLVDIGLKQPTEFRFESYET